MEKRKFISHNFGGLIILINLLLIVKICLLVINGNDKAVLFFLFYYPILIVINLIIGFIANRWIEIVARYFVLSAVGMAIIGFPLLLYITSFG